MDRFKSTGYVYLPASLLDEQEYCELRLHYKVAEGKAGPLKPGQARATIREALLKVNEARFGGVRGFKKIRVAGEIFGIPVAASPDAALIQDNFVTALLRGRIREPPRAYDADYTRLLAAAYLLDKAGILADDARLAVIVGRNPSTLKMLVEIIAKEGPKPLKNEYGIIEVRVYSKEDATRILNNLMAYWRGEREPIARPSPSKCVTCNYALQCPHAILPSTLRKS